MDDRRSPAEREAPGAAFAPVPVAPARRLGRGRIMAVVVVALAIVVVGLGVAGRSADEAPAPPTAAAVIAPSGAPPGSPGTPGSSPSPRPTRAVIPAVPCNERPPVMPLRVFLIVEGGPVAPGASPGTAAVPEVRVPAGAAVLLILGAEDCALAWRVWAEPVVPGRVIELAHQANPRGDPSFASQNRWAVAGLPAGDYLLTADLDLGGGRTTVAAWRLLVAGGSPAPAAS